jgi:ABC-2 type transport system ATP-binding protein
LYRRTFYQQLLEEYFDHNKTILIATHQVEEIENILTDLMFIRDGKLTLNASIEDINARFIEVQVAPKNLEAARAQKPIDERTQLGKTTMLFDGVPVGVLEKLGECRNSNIADIFVATMKDAI